MATFRIPILIWQNFGGSFTAQAVTGGEDYFPPAAFAERKDLAISEVKEYLQWHFEQEWWREPIEFQDLKLSEFRVEIRPEYKAKIHEEDEMKRKKRRFHFSTRIVNLSTSLATLRLRCRGRPSHHHPGERER